MAQPPGRRGSRRARKRILQRGLTADQIINAGYERRMRADRLKAVTGSLLELKTPTGQDGLRRSGPVPKEVIEDRRPRQRRTGVAKPGSKRNGTRPQPVPGRRTAATGAPRPAIERPKPGGPAQVGQKPAGNRPKRAKAAPATRAAIERQLPAPDQRQLRRRIIR